MKKVFIINAFGTNPFSQGALNTSLTEKAQARLKANGYEVQVTTMTDEWNVDAEIEKHQWADAVILQSPVNWMGLPWIFKKYMDEVYSAGMDGRLTQFDGRVKDDPSKQYGSGGALDGTRYMLSLTFNAPEHAFNDAGQYLFQGRTVDDLFFAAHMNFRFFAMEQLPTFAAYDVMKNPSIEADFERFDAHLDTHFPKAA